MSSSQTLNIQTVTTGSSNSTQCHTSVVSNSLVEDEALAPNYYFNFNRIWCERRDLNPGSSAPLEAIVPPYAAAMRQALDRGDLEAVRRMLDLLAALGGEVA